MKRVTVNINGIDYNLKGEENDDYLKYLASYVDGKVKEITGNNSKLSYAAATVLVSINMADDMFKAKRALEKVESEANDKEKQREKLEDFTTYLKDNNIKLENENKELKIRNDEIEAELEELKLALEELKANPIIKETSEEEIEKLKETNNILEEDARKLKIENDNIQNINKELKFSMHTSKYKVMDLQKKLFDLQMELAKEKAANNPLLNIEKLK